MNKRKINMVVCAAALLFIDFATSAQTIKTRLDKRKIHIGEQIQLELIVDGAKTTSSWFQFPDSINHMEVVSRSKIDTSLQGGHLNYHQIIILTSFDSGRWKFPSLAIAGMQQVTAPFHIDVLPADVSKLKDYNDIKEIEEVEPVTNWKLYAIIAAAILVCVALAWWLLKRRKKKPKAFPGSNLSPLQWALAELKKLAPSSHNSPDETKKFYSELTNISRTFFDMQLMQKAYTKTTEEWMLSLQSIDVSNNIKTSFFQLLRISDAVKFAKYLPPANEYIAAIEAAKVMFEKTALLHSEVYSKYQPGTAGSKKSEVEN